jgi:hypothetical protein
MWMLRGTRVENSHCSGAFVALCGGIFAGLSSLLHSSSSAPLLAAAALIADLSDSCTNASTLGASAKPHNGVQGPAVQTKTLPVAAADLQSQGACRDFDADHEVWSEEHCMRLARALAAEVDTFSGFCGRLAEQQCLKPVWPKGLTQGTM